MGSAHAENQAYSTGSDPVKPRQRCHLTSFTDPSAASATPGAAPYNRRMTVLIDQAIWPAHDTVWGHLVSDSSLEELHAFAQRAGIPRRAFDLDHYDYPAHRYEALVALGALPVTGRELVERLARSGLRVSQREKRGLGGRASASNGR